jgi:TPR repeat protein
MNLPYRLLAVLLVAINAAAVVPQVRAAPAGPAASEAADNAADTARVMQLWYDRAQSVGLIDQAYEADDAGNKALALKLWLQSAESGDAYAQSVLGTLLYSGYGGAALNVPQALNWWWKAADQGEPAAMHSLAALYAAPYIKEMQNAATAEAPGDKVLAYALYALADKGGLRKSGVTLKEISKLMTPDQVAQGQALAMEWQPGLFLRQLRK